MCILDLSTNLLSANMVLFILFIVFLAEKRQLFTDDKLSVAS